jgi:hypothetical protein
MKTIKRGSLKIRADFNQASSTVQYAVVDKSFPDEEDEWKDSPFQVAEISGPGDAFILIRKFLRDNAPG